MSLLLIFSRSSFGTQVNITHDLWAGISTIQTRNHDLSTLINSTLTIAADSLVALSRSAATIVDTRQEIAGAINILADTRAVISSVSYAVGQDTRLAVCSQINRASDLLTAIYWALGADHDTEVLIALASQTALVVYQLAAETRQFMMPSEVITQSLDSEQRLKVCPDEWRLFLLASERRVFEV